MSAVWFRYTFADNTARNAFVYKQEDVNQWVGIGSAHPYVVYRIASVSSAGVATFDQIASSTGGSGISGSSLLSCIPSSPGTLDYEFEDTSLTGFSFYDLTGGAARVPSGTVDPYTALTGATAVPRTTVHTAGRASWCRVQVTDSTIATAMYKSFTPATNAFYYCRACFTTTGNASPGSGSQLLFSLWADTGGHPDTNNRVYVGYLVSGGAFSLASDSINGGAGGGVTTAVSFGAPRYEYFGIHKVGTAYYTCVITEGGHKQWLKSGGFTNAFTPAYIGWQMTCANTNKPYDIFDYDLVRESDVATNLPI